MLKFRNVVCISSLIVEAAAQFPAVAKAGSKAWWEPWLQQGCELGHCLLVVE